MMKSDNTMESNESTEDRDRRNRELNEKKFFESDGENILLSEKKDSRWDNLIFIDVQFYINDFLFKEEFLWDKKICSPSQIKEYCCYILRENTLSKDKNYSRLPEGLERFSLDFLESCAEYMTRKILEEIRFYKKFQPFELFKDDVFGTGCGIEKEHLININLDITGERLTYKDSLQWDIINEENIVIMYRPEDFAHTVVKEFNLPNEFINLIALSIRKHIKEHVFATLGSLTEIFINLKENLYDKNYSSAKDNFPLLNSCESEKAQKISQIEEKKASATSTRTLFATYNTNSAINQKVKLSYRNNSELMQINKIDNKLSQVVPFLFEYKLESQLGRKISRNIQKEAKPSFIKNQIKKKEKKQRANSYLSMPNLANTKDYSGAIYQKSNELAIFNENVSIINPNTIEISKKVLLYKDYFDIIVIEKRNVMEFLNDLNI